MNGAINLSKTALTKGQELLIAKDQNYALDPYNLFHVDYVTVVESICPKLMHRS